MKSNDDENKKDDKQTNNSSTKTETTVPECNTNSSIDLSRVQSRHSDAIRNVRYNPYRKSTSSQTKSKEPNTNIARYNPYSKTSPTTRSSSSLNGNKTRLQTDANPYKSSNESSITNSITQGVVGSPTNKINGYKIKSIESPVCSAVRPKNPYAKKRTTVSSLEDVSHCGASEKSSARRTLQKATCHRVVKSKDTEPTKSILKVKKNVSFRRPTQDEIDESEDDNESDGEDTTINDEAIARAWDEYEKSEKFRKYNIFKK